jgi:hypothetical protein
MKDMKDNIKILNLKGKVYTIIKMKMYMRGNGRMASVKEKEL